MKLPPSDASVSLVGRSPARHPVPEAFIFDLVILPAFRRRGFAEDAMLELEVYVRRLGLTQISLHVFEHNTVASALYDKLGFVAFNNRLIKKLA